MKKALAFGCLTGLFLLAVFAMPGNGPYPNPSGGGGGSGSQTPLIQPVNAAQYPITNISYLQVTGAATNQSLVVSNTITAGGTVTATLFSGSGASLTGIPASAIVGLGVLAGTNSFASSYFTGVQVSGGTTNFTQVPSTGTAGGNVVLSSGAFMTNAVVTNSTFAGNGNGLTNINATALFGQLPNTVTNIYKFTNSPISGAVPVSDGTPTNLYFLTPGLVVTNLTSGQFYTNNSQYYQLLSVQVTNTAAAVAGDTFMELRITGQVTNRVGMTTLITSIAMSYPDMLYGTIPPSGGIYCLSNTSTGTGNSSALGNAQLLTLP
jgi:hypothetical protein